MEANPSLWLNVHNLIYIKLGSHRSLASTSALLLRVLILILMHESISVASFVGSASLSLLLSHALCELTESPHFLMTLSRLCSLLLGGGELLVLTLFRRVTVSW